MDIDPRHAIFSRAKVARRIEIARAYSERRDNERVETYSLRGTTRDCHPE